MKAARPSFRPVGKNMSACTRCGAVVADEQHTPTMARPACGTARAAQPRHRGAVMAVHKTMRGVRVKDADQGTVEAVFATLGVRDHDGDVILPGAFEEGQKVRISAFGHASWGGALPVGKGTIHERGDEAILDGQFFMDTQHGKDTFATVRGLEGLGEWSFGFDLRTGSTRDGEHQGEQVQFIGPLPDGTAGIDTHEVSPVLLGAGINTRTLAVKGLDKLSPGQLGQLEQIIEQAVKGGVILDKAAMSAHSTDTADREWDRDAVVSALPNDAETLRYVHAWRDADGDPDAKATYRFPHHHGSGGAANIRACRTGIAVLNGARGGTTIPDSDRQGVYNHLARHMRDTDEDVPELRARDDGGTKLSDQLAAAVADVQQVTDRLRDVQTLRSEQGKSLGQQSHDVAAELESACKTLREVLTSADGPGVDLDADVQLELERARFRL